jgi:hypothetical protein
MNGSMSRSPSRFLCTCIIFLCTCITILCSCTKGPATLSIQLRVAEGQHPLALADEVTLSLADGMDRTLALERAAPSAMELSLAPVPAGSGYRLDLTGTFHGDTLARGRSCRFDVPGAAVPLYLGEVGRFAATGAPSAVRMGAVAFADGERALLVGGDAGQGPTAGSESYSPATASFGAAETLNAARSGASWATLAGAPVVVGGAVANPAVETLSGAAWSPVLTLIPPALTESAAVTLGDGTVLVCGGRAQPGGAPLADAWLIGGALTPQSPLSTARAGHTLTPAGGGRADAVYVIGGAPDIEIYDPVTAGFAPLGLRLMTPRRRHTATLLPSGRVLVAGGVDDGGVALASAEIIDALTRRVLATEPMRTARAGHTATLLPSGRVLIAGGGTSGVEVFDPDLGPAGAFVDTEPMQVARTGHAAVALCDGTLLFVGGGAGAERYVPLP